MRIVVDANVFASALLNPLGSPGVVASLIFKNEKLELVLSSAIVEEIRRILFYPKLRKYLKRSDVEITTWVDALEAIAFMIKPQFTYPVIVREDPEDDKYVIAALESNSRILISGDKHLLRLGSYQGVRILTPADFLKTTLFPK